MLDPVVRIVLVSAGGASLLLAFWLVVKDWRRTRGSGRATAAFYAGAVLVVVGLQPIRTFRMGYSEPYMLPPLAAAQERLLEKLETDGWIIGAARPERLVERDHPLQSEIAARFARYVENDPRLLQDEAPPFVFVGRKIAGLSRNPDTAAVTLVFLAFVLLLSGCRRVLGRL
ncbi:MAG: hypothetical protein JXQ29_06435 [Planctomycetes bacterium]|nr:hypothetical protein [Planctomycetota bacterium]